MYLQHGEKRFLCPEPTCTRMFHSSVTLVKHATRNHEHLVRHVCILRSMFIHARAVQLLELVQKVKATALHESKALPTQVAAANAAAGIFDTTDEDAATPTMRAYGGPFTCPLLACRAVFRVSAL
jgi:hypothetical protein